MTPFRTILAEAERRNGGAAGLAAVLPVAKSPAELAAVPDDRYLSAMSLRIFRAGLKHELVDAKWPAFEEVFHRFEPRRVRAMSDEAMERLMGDKRLIRHWGKLKSVSGLNEWGGFSGEPKGKADRAKVEAALLAWAKEAKRPLCQVSMILARATDHAGSPPPHRGARAAARP